jgi:putative restriction endonuclease
MSISVSTLHHFYETELLDASTNYFIFDSDEKKHHDIPFKVYTYEKQRYNLVKEGDLFIYRKPTKSSSNGKFYFFGTGRIRKLDYIQTSSTSTRVNAVVDKCVPFAKWVFQDEILNYQWQWKQKKNAESFGQFFSNYGMNKVPKEDFIYLASLGISDNELDKEYKEIEIELTRKTEQGDYDVPDTFATVKTRGAAQAVFSNKLREIYNNRCCITGITTSSLLVGAHIVPWSVREDIRLDPQNGLLLSVLVDKLFENGSITIDADYRIHILPALREDEVLYKLVSKYEGQRITLPAAPYKPNKLFLEEKMNLIKKIPSATHNLQKV